MEKSWNFFLRFLWEPWKKLLHIIDDNEIMWYAQTYGYHERAAMTTDTHNNDSGSVAIASFDLDKSIGKNHIVTGNVIA